MIDPTSVILMNASFVGHPPKYTNKMIIPASDKLKSIKHENNIAPSHCLPLPVP
jgi:hypothetical protein